MRLDKLTTKFQQALADAQSLAVGNDNSYVERSRLRSGLFAQETALQSLASSFSY